MLRNTSHRSRLRRAAAGLVALTLIATACGGDDDASDDEPAADEPVADEPAAEEPAADEPAAEEPAAEEPAAEEPAAEEPAAEEPATDDGLAAVQADVERFLAGDVELPAPTDPVEPGDRTVAIIAAGMASTGPATVATAMQDAVGVIGWETDGPFDGQFTPTEQATGISEAVADGVDAILLVAITPSAVAAAVAEAQAASIPIVCVLCGPDPITEGIYNVEADADAAGYAQAAYATAMSDGTGTIVLYQNDEFRFSAEQGAATEAYLAEICPDCTVDVRSVLLLEAREPNAPIHTSLLEEYGEGELDFVIHPFDSPSGALATTASQLGRTDFGVIGYGALSPFVDMIGVGEPAVAEASVTISSPYYGWAAVDIAARVLNGDDLWAADDMPVALITMDNFGTYPEGLPYLYPDFEFAEYFGQLWGS